ncbi:MAG: hypothetical protein QNJ19_11205 [Woeseiaceae bacterium]|nr:hypothetical protein [Woeseiaceae bacterium]
MKKALAAALAVAAAIGIVLFLGAEHQKPDSTEGAAADSASVPSANASSEFGPEVSDEAEMPAHDGDSTTAENDDTGPQTCPSFRPDPSHPWFMAEMARLEPLAPEGPGMAVYRGLSESDLESLAAQKDSGAMIILGRRAELRAEGKPEDDAVGQLDGQNSTTRSWSNSKNLEEDVRAALVEAEHWYYQAVLHGRLFAMFHVGILRERLNGGPVEQGWIDADSFAGMDSEQRLDYWPAMVYQAAATALAPEVAQSPMMVLALEGLERPGDPATVELVVNQLRADLQQSGLTLPDIPAYEGPGIDEWRREFCRND